MGCVWRAVRAASCVLNHLLVELPLQRQHGTLQWRTLKAPRPTGLQHLCTPTPCHSDNVDDYVVHDPLLEKVGAGLVDWTPGARLRCTACQAWLARPTGARSKAAEAAVRLRSWLPAPPHPPQPQGKEKFNRQQQKMKKRQSEWAGRAQG